jgi:LCP family protein required for cell wall assembly
MTSDDPLAGRERLGQQIGQDQSRGPSRRARHRPKRKKWKVALVVGLALLVVAAGLVGGQYAYVQWKLSQIKSMRCHSCMATTAGKLFNVLIVGSDSRAGDSGSAAKFFGSASQVGGQRSDTIKVVHVDPSARTARVLSIPRDTFVNLSGMPADSQLSNKNKINTAFDAGIDPLVQTIQNTLGIPINHYVTIDFSGVINLVNAVGTISLDFPYPARDDDNGNNNSGLQITHPGCQTLDGNMALALARSRYYQYYEDGYWHSDPSSDLGRIERQNIVISAIISKAKSDLNPIDLNRVLDAVVPDITKDTGLSGNDMVNLATQYHAFSASSLESWTRQRLASPPAATAMSRSSTLDRPSKSLVSSWVRPHRCLSSPHRLTATAIPRTSPSRPEVRPRARRRLPQTLAAERLQARQHRFRDNRQLSSIQPSADAQAITTQTHGRRNVLTCAS